MFIQLSEALATMRKLDERGRPLPFSLEVTTCDEQRDTGGENLVLTNWVLHGPKATPNNERRVRKPQPPKPVNELADQMRNVRNPANGEIRQISIRLITVFNGLLILW
jgi:hypothetical protein